MWAIVATLVEEGVEWDGERAGWPPRFGAVLDAVPPSLHRSLIADEEHGPLPALMLSLTFVTGMVDAISVLTLDKVFVSNMTGNTVFIGFALAGAADFNLLRLLPAIAGFLLGAWLAGSVDYRLQRPRHVLLRYVTATQATLFGVAVVVAALSGGYPESQATFVVIVLLAVAMGMQNAMARRLSVPDLLTSLATMTLVALVADIGRQESAAVTRRLTSLACMVIGACTGAVLVLHVGLVVSLTAVAVVLVLVAVAAWAAGREGDVEWQRRRDRPSPPAGAEP